MTGIYTEDKKRTAMPVVIAPVKTRLRFGACNGDSLPPWPTVYLSACLSSTASEVLSREDVRNLPVSTPVAQGPCSQRKARMPKRSVGDVTRRLQRHRQLVRGTGRPIWHAPVRRGRSEDETRGRWEESRRGPGSTSCIYSIDAQNGTRKGHKTPN
jgi:hypothetical protein